MNGRKARERRRATPQLTGQLQERLELARADRDRALTAAAAALQQRRREAEQEYRRERELALSRFASRRQAIEASAPFAEAVAAR